jgi:hypothetical protein
MLKDKVHSLLYVPPAAKKRIFHTRFKNQQEFYE